MMSQQTDTNIEEFKLKLSTSEDSLNHSCSRGAATKKAQSPLTTNENTAQSEST